MPAGPHSDIETALLQTIHEFFEERSGTNHVVDSVAVTDGRLQLATTVLFLQMIAADHGSRHDEHEALLGILARVLRIEGDRAETRPIATVRCGFR